MATSSTDIVDRLRKPPAIEQFRDPAKLIGDMQAEQIEAANEIVRLRSSLFRVQNWLQDAHLVLERSITETVEALDD